jgi:hypothetical protein
MPMHLSNLTADPSVASRTALSPKRVDHYIQIVLSGEDLDPVIVFCDGQTNWLSDGFQRFEAYKKADRTDIPAEIRDGTKRDAILYAIEANAKHGLILSLAERKNAAAMLLNDSEWSQWTDRCIGRICGLEHHTIGRIRNRCTSINTAEQKTSVAEFSSSPIPNDLNDHLLRSVSGENPQIKNFTNLEEVTTNVRRAQRGGNSYTIKTNNIGRGLRKAVSNEIFVDTTTPALPPSKVEIIDLDPLTINTVSTTVQETNDDFRIVSIDCPEPAETSDEIVEFNVKVETLGPPEAWPTILNQLKAHPEFASMVWKEALKLELADTFKKDLLLVQ